MRFTKSMITVAIGTMVLTGTVLTGTSYADTTNSSDVTSLKQLREQEQDLNKQINHQREANQDAWIRKADVSEDVREKVKEVLGEIRILHQKISDLHEELKEAEHNNQTEKVESLKEQIKDLEGQIKVQRDSIKDKLDQIKQANQTLRKELKPIWDEEKETWSQIKDLNKQRRVAYSLLKEDRENKNQAGVEKDLDTLTQIEKSEIVQKQQLQQETQQVGNILNN